jgi:hypothetical protein
MRASGLADHAVTTACGPTPPAMKSFFLLLLLAGVAHAGTHDTLTNANTCVAAPTMAIGLPEADGGHSADFVEAQRQGKEAYDVEWKGESGNGPVMKKNRSMPSWCAAQVTVNGETLIMSGLEVVYTASEMGEEIGMITQWAYPISDKAANAAADAGTLAVPSNEGTDGAPRLTKILLQKITSTKALAAMAIGNEFVLAGSASGQIYKGAEAKKKLAAWNLDLSIDPAQVRSEVVQGTKAAYVMVNVLARPHGKSDGPTITYRVLFGMVNTSGKTWKVGLAHFALVK